MNWTIEWLDIEAAKIGGSVQRNHTGDHKSCEYVFIPHKDTSSRWIFCQSLGAVAEVLKEHGVVFPYIPFKEG